VKHAKSVTKAEIIKRLIDECGFTYIQALAAHKCLVSQIESAVIELKKFPIGHIGVIVPKVAKGKSVSMNFSRTATGTEKSQRYFFLDERPKFTLRLHRSFFNKANFRSPYD
jgi:hypothetical protein